MAAQGDDPSFFESEIDESIEMTLIDPSGTALENFPFKHNTSVQEEKERILDELNDPQDPNNFVLKLLLPGDQEKVMDDHTPMASYKDYFASATVKFEAHINAQDKSCGQVSPEVFGCKMK